MYLNQIDRPVEILIVEDNPGDVRLVRRLLRDGSAPGLTITDVSTLGAAIERLGEVDVDLILLDLGLPDGDGPSLVEALRAHAPLVPIIILARRVDGPSAVESLPLWAEDYLIKEELEPTALWRSVRYALDRSGLVRQREQALAALRASEARLMKEKKRAEEASRLKTQFLANMSHELRTPLNGIMGMTELVLETTLDAEQRSHLEIVQESSLRLLELINGLLDMSKVEAGRFDIRVEEFDLWDVVGETLKPLHVVAAKKGVVLLYREAQGVPARVAGDPTVLRQIVSNIVGNAVKFTDRGAVTVSISAETVDRRPTLLLSVEDTGPGISKAQRARVFEPFYQSDGTSTRKHGGTGLGLALVASLVDLADGSLEVESDVGAGSRFHVRLPFEGVRPGSRLELGLPITGVPTALVVEPTSSERAILMEYLERAGVRADGAASFDEARDSLTGGRQGYYDVVVVCSGLDATPAFDLLGRAAGSDRRPALVMISGAGRRGDGARCEELGVDSYLMKPVSPRELAHCVGLSLGRRATPDGPLVTRHSIREGGPGQRILLVEDDAVNRILAEHMLRSLGHSVVTATDGAEAMALFRGGAVDAVVMDVQMPVMDGLDATRQMREHEKATGRARTPIIALTAHAMPGDRERCLAAGMDGYLTKPITRGSLREALTRLQRREASA